MTVAIVLLFLAGVLGAIARLWGRPDPRQQFMVDLYSERLGEEPGNASVGNSGSVRRAS